MLRPLLMMFAALSLSACATGPQPVPGFHTSAVQNYRTPEGEAWTISADSPPGPTATFAINGEQVGACQFNQWNSCALGTVYRNKAVGIDCKRGLCAVTVDGNTAAALDLRPQ